MMQNEKRKVEVEMNSKGLAAVITGLVLQLIFWAVVLVACNDDSGNYSSSHSSSYSSSGYSDKYISEHDNYISDEELTDFVNTYKDSLGW